MSSTDSPSPAQSSLAAFLRDSNARCPSCGYALRGCTSDKCPECGTALSLSINVQMAPSSASWIAATFGCGFSTLIALVLLVQTLQYVAFALHNPGMVQTVRAGFAPVGDLPHWSAVFLAVILTLLSGAALAWLIARRRAFATWPLARRIVVGLVCWLSPMIMLALIAWWIGG